MENEYHCIQNIFFIIWESKKKLVVPKIALELISLEENMPMISPLNKTDLKKYTRIKFLPYSLAIPQNL